MHFQSSSSSVTSKSPTYKLSNAEHYRVSLCRSDTSSCFLLITFPTLENKRSLATDVAGTASSRLATVALLLTDTIDSSDVIVN